jgi:hypothetical protein
VRVLESVAVFPVEAHPAISREASSVSVIEKTLMASYIAYFENSTDLDAGSLADDAHRRVNAYHKRSKEVDSALLSSVRSLCKK